MLNVQNIQFAYQQDVPVIQDVSFEVLRGEKLCILGESGSGKSTVLKILYSELQKDSGKIIFEKEEIKGKDFQLLPGHENMHYVPQDFNLDAYITVQEIVGKYVSNINKDFKNQRVLEVLRALQIVELKDKKPHELSGGQKQRVAIARAIVNPPTLLLLDEPFSQLDASLHVEIRDNLFDFLERNKISVIFTSHRAEDALGYSDKVLILKEGKVIQHESPTRLYNAPINAYVARLFGQVNILNSEQAKKLKFSRNFLKNKIVIYPEEFNIHTRGEFTAFVLRNRFFGRHYEITFRHQGILLKAYHSKPIPPKSKIQFDIINYRWVV